MEGQNGDVRIEDGEDTYHNNCDRNQDPVAGPVPRQYILVQVREL